MQLLHTSPHTRLIKLFSSWLEATRSMGVLAVGSLPWLSRKRNAAEELVSPGPTTKTLLVGREKTHSPQFSTMNAQCNSVPPSSCPSQAQKDAAGDEALAKAKPSCCPFIHLPQPAPSCCQALSTCRLHSRSCSYLLETAKVLGRAVAGVTSIQQ